MTNPKNILVIGGEGYIGSVVMVKLIEMFPNTEIHSMDVGWFSDPQKTFLLEARNRPIIINYQNGSNKMISSPLCPEKLISFNRYDILQLTTFDRINEFFDVVVWLAGHSSVAMCSGDMSSARKNNVEVFEKFVKSYFKSIKKPLFIFASSASIYGNEHKEFSLETDIPNPVMEYDKTMYEREMIVHAEFNKYSDSTHFVNTEMTPKIVCLRFGTVNGPSHNMRNELMLNSMIWYGMKEGVIPMSNPKTRRSILNIDTLANVIHSIIKRNFDMEIIYTKDFVFNTATASTTVQFLSEMARSALMYANYKVTIENKYNTDPSPYSFWMDTHKLSQFIGIKVQIFDPIIDISTICNRLIKSYETEYDVNFSRNEIWFLPSRLGNRNQNKEY